MFLPNNTLRLKESWPVETLCVKPTVGVPNLQSKKPTKVSPQIQIHNPNNT
jgi:hypothetical protein